MSCENIILKIYFKYLYIIMVVFIVLPFKIIVQCFYCNTVIHIIMRSKNRLSFIVNVYHLFFWFRMFVRFSLLGKSWGNHCNSQSWESEVWCIFHRKKYIYEMTHSLHVLCPYFSDAMETEDKAGSSPAGKTVEVVSLHFQSFNSSDIRLV